MEESHHFDMSIPEGHWVNTDEEALAWYNYFVESAKIRKHLGLDSETTGLSTSRDYIIIWSISDGLQRICLPSRYIELFKPLLEDPEVTFSFTHAKYDAHMFANAGVDLTLAGNWYDTSVQSWLINENNLGRHGLKECMEDHLNRKVPTFEETFGKIPSKRNGIKKTIGDMIHDALKDPVRCFKAADYASLDSYDSLVLRFHFDEKMKELHISPDQTLYDYYHRIEVPFTKVLWKMERRGVTVNPTHLAEQKVQMEEEMKEIVEQFSEAAAPFYNAEAIAKGEKAGLYNINLSSSSPDSKWFFYDVLKKPVEHWTDGGASGNKKPALDADILDDWAGEGDAWAELLLRHRDLDKTYGTYVVGLAKHQRPEVGDFRIHTSLNQHGTVTGRLSSSQPNLQNIPRANNDRFGIRKAFIPAPGKILIVADYAQLEMRLMAHFSQDEKMVTAIRSNIDLHCLTVSEMEGIPYDEVIAAVKADKKLKKGELGRELTAREFDLLLKRQNNKSTGFGIIYGIGGPKLAAKLTRETGHYLSPQEGIMLIKKWLNVFPGVRHYIDYTQDFLRRYEKVQTLLGRYRRFGSIRYMSKQESSRAERQGVNSIIQGSAADIAKSAMLQAEYDPELNDLECEMLLQVHDELMFEMPDDNKENIDAAKKRVQEIMEHPFLEDLLVALPAEVGSGYTWADAK